MLLTDSDSRVAAIVISLLVLLFAEIGFQVISVSLEPMPTVQILLQQHP